MVNRMSEEKKFKCDCGATFETDEDLHDHDLEETCRIEVEERYFVIIAPI